MADAQLRYGLRILFSGGASLLEMEELTMLYNVVKSAIDDRAYSVINLDQLFTDINKRCHGGVSRLKNAYKIKYGKELEAASDLIPVCPKKLLSIDDFGFKSLLALKEALQAQLKPHNLPLPTRWQIAPSWQFERVWAED